MALQRLGDYISLSGHLAAIHATEHTLGYAMAHTFQFATIAAIGSWTTYLTASLVGSMLLFVPFCMALKYVLNKNQPNHFAFDILRLVSTVAAPVIGALFLNAFFAWTLPLMPVLFCAAISGGVHLCFSARSDADTKNKDPRLDRNRLWQQATARQDSNEAYQVTIYR